MSVVLIRRALEQRLAALDAAFPTAWENQEYTPVSGTPFQKVFLLPNETQSPTFGSTELIRELGLLQVSLYYPLNKGMKDVGVKAEAIRAYFPKGLSLTSGGVTVQITKRASVAPAMREGEWTVVVVSIPYFANIFV